MRRSLDAGRWVVRVTRFVSRIGGTLPSADPFTASLVPEVSKYCR